MMQITIDDFIEVESIKKIICCSLTKNYHWLRITIGNTPDRFKDKIDFILGEYEYLYVGINEKDEILSDFKGTVEHVSFNFQKDKRG